jgi:hypothetical protein
MGAPTHADVQRALLPRVAAQRALLPLVQGGERRAAPMTPHPPSSPRHHHGGCARPCEPWSRAVDQTKPSQKSPYLARQMSEAKCSSRVAECTRLSPEDVKLGGSQGLA